MTAPGGSGAKGSGDVVGEENPGKRGVGGGGGSGWTIPGSVPAGTVAAGGTAGRGETIGAGNAWPGAGSVSVGTTAP